MLLNGRARDEHRHQAPKPQQPRGTCGHSVAVTEAAVFAEFSNPFEEDTMRKDLGTSKVESVEHDFTACLETDTRDHLIGRRDMLVGLWAGEQLGLPGESRAIYALEVMAAGLLKTGREDVVDKISRDFVKRGVDITRGEILVQVSKKHRLAIAMQIGVPTSIAQEDHPQKES